MASGFGVNGGTGRCYQFWVDYAACIKTAETATTCSEKREVNIIQSVVHVMSMVVSLVSFVLESVCSNLARRSAIPIAHN